MGLSQALHGGDPRPDGERDRTPRRPAQRGAHPALRRRQPGHPARHLSRRGGARRVRADEPAPVGRGDPPGARRPRRLGDLRRDAEGPQRVLAQIPRGFRRPRLVRGVVRRIGHRRPAGRRTRGGAPRHDVGGLRPGVRMLLRGRGPGRLLRPPGRRGRARGAHLRRTARSGAAGGDRVGPRHRRRHRDLVRPARRRRDPRARLLRGGGRRARTLCAAAAGEGGGPRLRLRQPLRAA